MRFQYNESILVLVCVLECSLVVIAFQGKWCLDCCAKCCHIAPFSTDYAYLFRTDFVIFVGLEFIFLMVVSVSFLYFEETM